MLLAMAQDAEQLRAQAKRIRQLRKDKERRDGESLSQETVAFHVGVSSKTYRTWEGVGAEIKLENLKALAAYYDVPMDWIERGDTPELMSKLADPVQEQLDRIEDRLTRMEVHLSTLESKREQQANQIGELVAQMETMRLEFAARAVEVLARLDEALPQQSQVRSRRPA